MVFYRVVAITVTFPAVILLVMFREAEILVQNNTNTKENASDLLAEPLEVISVGLEGFATDLRNQDIPVIHLDWTPPAGGDPYLAELLSKLGA